MENILMDILSYFDFRFMAFVFLTAQVLLKYTALRAFKTNYKRLIVLGIGILYGLLFAHTDHLLTNIVQSTIFILIKYGISIFSTVLFYDVIYKKVVNKLKT